MCFFCLVILNRLLFRLLTQPLPKPMSPLRICHLHEQGDRSTVYDSLRSTAAWIERDLILRVEKSQNNETPLPSLALLQARRSYVWEGRLVLWTWGYLLLSFPFFPPRAACCYVSSVEVWPASAGCCCCWWQLFKKVTSAYTDNTVPGLRTRTLITTAAAFVLLLVTLAGHPDCTLLWIMEGKIRVETRAPHSAFLPAKGDVLPAANVSVVTVLNVSGNCAFTFPSQDCSTLQRSSSFSWHSV